MEVAIIIPCLNESLTVAKVIQDCQKALPEAVIYVFDNNSTDNTAKIAAQNGAVVVPSPTPGKGHVIQHAFRVIESHYYIMIDGDDTYDASICREILRSLEEDHFDMVVATRLHGHSQDAFRGGHLFGNKLFSKTVSFVFGKKITDIFSGFRGFSRTFVKTVPLQSRGFEVESDLTLQSITMGFEILEIPANYKDRPYGSLSKLKTYSDGLRILKFILGIAKDHRPLSMFTSLAILSLVLSAASGWAPITDYMKYAYVYTVPRAVLAASLAILSAILFAVGLILDSQRRYHQQQLRMLVSLFRQKEMTPIQLHQESLGSFHGAKRFKN